MALSRIFIRALLRRASAEITNEAPTGNRAWLLALQTAAMSNATSGSLLVSSSVNGRAFTFQIPPDMTPTELVNACELALSCLDTGLAPTTIVKPLF